MCIQYYGECKHKYVAWVKFLPIEVETWEKSLFLKINMKESKDTRITALTI